MSPYNKSEEPRLGHVSTGLGEATLTRSGDTYTLEVAGVEVRVALNKRHPHAVIVNGHNFEVHSSILTGQSFYPKSLDRG